LRNELTLPLRPPGFVFDIVFVAQQDLSAQFAWVTQQSLTFAGDWGDFGRGTATPADATGARDAMVKSAAMRLSVLVFIFLLVRFRMVDCEVSRFRLVLHRPTCEPLKLFELLRALVVFSTATKKACGNKSAGFVTN
jgi:hypothetical protein